MEHAKLIATQGLVAVTVSESLRQALASRVEGGMSAYRISLESGVGAAVVTRFLNGERGDIRASSIDKLAEYLGLELKPKGKK